MPFFRLKENTIDDAEVESFTFNLVTETISVFLKSGEVKHLQADLAGANYLDVLESALNIPVPERHAQS